MAVENLAHNATSSPSIIFSGPDIHATRSYECELRIYRCMEIRLREALVREKALLCQNNELTQKLIHTNRLRF